ncbi:FAD-dependent oxidoreductase [Geobacter sp. FeAm09]|uniref:FAD-dependent oxidoreductase n=1 Tax=Geobacter sp. FeAm09 TaxID=2597769 RepID=UPI0011EDF222|nr:FAD-dependent oxidoreductase [Geobacter sp. FeAm09]QEM68733.1 FAD-dependent oxidoreductase [Geobacter sp. FeAm09]
MRIIGKTWFMNMVVMTACLVATPLYAATPQFTDETEVVVVGAGGAGLSASLTLAQGGAKVILLEQNPFPGGTSNVAEGVLGVESRMQRDHYYGPPMLTKDMVFKHEMDYTHWKGNAKLMRAFINQSGETINWLQDEGVPFEEVAMTTFDGVRTWHVIDGHGASLVKVLFGKLKQSPNVKILMETPAIGLITDDNKRVVGVTAKGKKGELRIKAKAVILATGGFADNPELVKKYVGNTFAGSVANFRKVGFALTEAMKLGAKTEGLGTVMNTAVYDKVRSGKPGPANPVDQQFDALGQQPMNIMVNVHGERFCDEVIANNFVLQSNAIERQPGSFAWVIFDENLRKHYVNDGIDGGMGVLVPAGTKLAKADGALDKYVAEGKRNIYAADSVEELAAKIQVPADALKKTIENYNSYAEHNHDAEYAKDPYFMKKLSGKLYAMREVLSYLVTVGGVSVNTRMQPLDRNEQPIKGLYVTGSDVGGLFGDSYGLASPGTTYGFAVGSGRMAARHILETLK